MLCQKAQQEGLKEMEASNAKAMAVCAEAINALDKSVIPKVGSHKLNQLAYITHPMLWKCAHARNAKGLRLCQPKAKAKVQTKAQVVALAPDVAGGAGSLIKAPIWRLLSANVRTEGLVLSWASICRGWYLSVLVAQINLRQDLLKKKKKRKFLENWK